MSNGMGFLRNVDGNKFKIQIEFSRGQILCIHLCKRMHEYFTFIVFGIASICSRCMVAKRQVQFSIDSQYTLGCFQNVFKK